jgi:rhamnosyltransferase
MSTHLPRRRADAPPAKETVCAVYVTYHPDAKFPERVARVTPQVAHVIIVDNHSNEMALGMLRTLCEVGGIELIENKDNFGIATALNQGARRAIECGYTWALTLDQDSWPEADLVSTFAEVYATHRDRQSIKIIGSNFRSPITSCSILYVKDTTSTSLETEAVITSCSLMALNVFEEIGPFRDDLFIDEVDHEYCLRLRSHGYKVIISCKPLVVHPLGNQIEHKFLWKNLVSSNHSPLRRYYITRNRLVLYKSYMRSESIWVRRSIYTAMIELIIITLYEKHKFKKLIAIMFGIWHAFSGRMGKLQNKALEMWWHEDAQDTT